MCDCPQVPLLPTVNHEQQQSQSNSMAESRRIVNFMTNGAMPHFPGPNDAKLNDILNRSGYNLELSNGQRKYCPAVNSAIHSDLDIPAANSEIFVGRIPKEIFEDELIPLFQTVGKLYDLRLMMDPGSGQSRGYAFITYFNKENATAAVQKFDGYEIRPGKLLKVKLSVPNVRLFVGNIPKEMTKNDIYFEFHKQSPGLTDVIVYLLPNERKRNRGFCFLEYETHKQASHAKRKLTSSRIKVWGAEILVDWAEPLEEPDEETMAKVKVLYVRNLQLSLDEDVIKSIFERFGPVDRVKKIKDYAFVHFERREWALNAMAALQGKEITPDSGMPIEISLAKPPSDKKRKEEILRNRERRLMNMMQNKSIYIQPNSFATCPTVAAQSYQTVLPPTAMTNGLCAGPSNEHYGHSDRSHSHGAHRHTSAHTGFGGLGILTTIPHTQLVSATFKSPSSVNGTLPTAYYGPHSTAHASVGGGFVAGPRALLHPSPSTVTRVTLGAQAPAPAPSVGADPMSVHTAVTHHNASHHFHHHPQTSLYHSTVAPPVANASVYTTGVSNKVSSEPVSCVTNARPTVVAPNHQKPLTICGPQASVQSNWNWYTWYDPNWWSCMMNHQ